MSAKFALSQLFAAPGILEASGCEDLRSYFPRHAAGDWGTINAEDKRANDRSSHDGTQLLSAYLLKNGAKIWVITEADRLASTVLLPSED